MQWILYTLGDNQDIQEQLYREVAGVNDPEKIMQSTLLRNYVREVLRLYPVAPFILRYLPNDSVIGGYRVQAGVCFMTLDYLVLHLVNVLID